MRHLHVKFAGIDFFKKVNDQEWNDIKDKYVVLKEGVKGRDQLAAFLAEE